MKTPRSLLVPLAFSSALLALPTFGLAATTVGQFTGGDPGEGLDLQGSFIYAINIGTVGAAGKVGDADFTADDVAGVKVTTVNQIPNWHAPEYGDSPNDDALEIVMQSIRWSADPEKPQIDLSGLVPGGTYKLQLLFAEQCCAGRAFDVLVNGTMIADEFNPAGVQGGAANTSAGAFISHEFTAGGSTLTVVLDGSTITTEEFNDHNPIINGLTLEQVSAPGDSDNDGLSDTWERLHFNNLSATGNADPDNDGLSNSEELAAGANPTLADTDKDTLQDGAEVKTHGSDPNKGDTDNDGLSDADEANVHGTSLKLADTDGDGLRDPDEIRRFKSNPKLADSDADGFSDHIEAFSGADPSNKSNIPRGTIISRFTGGDVGEGLDLDGTFPFAFNVGTVDGAPFAPGKVRDADFVGDDSAGIVVAAGNEAPTWQTANYGSSANDEILEAIMKSIRWSNAASVDQPTVNVDLSGLTVGRRYKLQLLFTEECCAGRAFDVLVEEKQIADEFNPASVQGGAGTKTVGVVLTHEFTAKDTVANIVLDGRTVTTPTFTDHNATLSGVTLEILNLGPDVDNDGLPDTWETGEFLNLLQTGSGDADNDGLSNLYEFENSMAANDADADDDGLNDGAEVNTHKTNPNIADSDKDGLNDGAEVNTHKTNALSSDSDADGLADGDEVTTHKTNPATKDSDGDGIEDGPEISGGTNPLVADAVQLSNIVVQSFSGGDADEGLDLDGNFVYAVNIGTGGTVGKVRDATFTADNVPGVRMQAGAQIANWHQADYGESPNDDNLEKVMRSIRHTPPVVLTFSNLVATSTYKLQLLFAEQCCAGRGFDILVDGRLMADDFIPANIQGGAGNTTAGAVVSAEFIAPRNQVVIVLQGTTVTNEEINDRNPILNGATLELIKLGTAPQSFKIAQVKVEGGGLNIAFDSIAGSRYAVEYRESLAAGAWQVISEVNATGTSSSFNEQDASRRGKSQGYYRIRSL